MTRRRSASKGGWEARQPQEDKEDHTTDQREKCGIQRKGEQQARDAKAALEELVDTVLNFQIMIGSFKFST